MGLLVDGGRLQELIEPLDFDRIKLGGIVGPLGDGSPLWPTETSSALTWPLPSTARRMA
jgi:hypothetical protein